MFFKVTREKLMKAGFQLEHCEDEDFWYIEQDAGQEADRIFRICQRVLIDFDAQPVRDVLLVQCGFDLSDPTLYIDGFLWKLSKQDLADIVRLLSRRQIPAVRSVGLTGPADRA